MRDRIEVLGQIGVYDFGVPLINGLVDSLYRIERASFRPVPIRRVIEVGFENRFECQLISIT